MLNLRYCTRVALISAALLPVDAGAAGIAIENHATMANFQAGPFYAFVTGGVGTNGRKANGVRGVRQGPSDVPASSAGAAGNTVVTPEVLAAAKDVPNVFSLSSTAQGGGTREVEALGENSAGPAAGTAVLWAHPLGTPSVDWGLASSPPLLPREESRFHRDSREPPPSHSRGVRATLLTITPLQNPG